MGWFRAGCTTMTLLAQLQLLLWTLSVIFLCFWRARLGVACVHQAAGIEDLWLP